MWQWVCKNLWCTEEAEIKCLDISNTLNSRNSIYAHFGTFLTCIFNRCHLKLFIARGDLKQIKYNTREARIADMQVFIR